MNTASKKLFLFLIPTLLTALVFVLVNQQNIFVADDSDSNSGNIKIEMPSKHLNHNSLPLAACFFNQEKYGPILIATGNTFISNFYFNDHKTHTIKNRSPPAYNFA